MEKTYRFIPILAIRDLVKGVTNLIKTESSILRMHRLI